MENQLSSFAVIWSLFFPNKLLCMWHPNERHVHYGL